MNTPIVKQQAKNHSSFGKPVLHEIHYKLGPSMETIKIEHSSLDYLVQKQSLWSP